MRKLLLVVLFNLCALSADFTVVKTVSDISSKHTLKIDVDTFIPNIMGYACPVPAINVKKDVFFYSRLVHRQFRNFGVVEAALEVKNPNMRFCTFPKPSDVFGIEFIVGAEVEIQVRTLLEIIEDERGNQFLQEEVSTTFLGEEVFSKSIIRL